MATKTITEVFNEVAEAIQEKKEDYTPIKPADFGDEIYNLKSVPESIIIANPSSHYLAVNLSHILELMPATLRSAHVEDFYPSESCNGYFEINLATWVAISSWDTYTGNISLYFSVSGDFVFRDGGQCSCEIYVDGQRHALGGQYTIPANATIAELIQLAISYNSYDIIEVPLNAGSGYIRLLQPTTLSPRFGGGAPSNIFETLAYKYNAMLDLNDYISVNEHKSMQ